MSATTFWGDVATCRRRLQLYRQLQDETRKPSLRWRLSRTLVPWAVVPLVALPWWELFDAPVYIGILVTSVCVFPAFAAVWPWRLTPFEALQMPSRGALYVARLVPFLPWCLWLGLWGTFGLLLSQGLLQDGTRAAFYLLSGTQVPWLILGLVGAMGLFQWKRSGLGCLSVLLVLAFIGPGALLGVRLIPDLGSFLPLLPAGILLLGIGLLAVQLWDLDRTEPMWQINLLNPVQPQQPMPAPWIMSIWWRSRPGPIGPMSLLAGRHGLGWAAVSYALSRLLAGGIRGVLLRSFPAVLLLVAIFLFWRGNVDWDTIWIWIYIGVMAVGTGSVFAVADPQRLYLLGVDYRCQLRHSLRTFWLTPLLMIVSLAAFFAVAVWGTIELPLALLAAAVGITLFREGWLGWPGWGVLPYVRGGRMFGASVLLMLGLVLWLLFLVGSGQWLGGPDPGWSRETRIYLFAAYSGLTGLAGIGYKWWRLDEATVAQAVQANEAATAQALHGAVVPARRIQK
jgi:hypothetical protein